MCMCVHIHTSVHTHKSCSDLLDIFKHSIYILGHLSAFCPRTRPSACIIMHNDKCLLIKIKAVSLGIYFWCIHLSQSYPHPQGPYSYHFFKELLAILPAELIFPHCVHSILFILKLEHSSLPYQYHTYILSPCSPRLNIS